MNPAAAAVSAAHVMKRAVPGLLPRMLLAAVPMVSLGMLGAVPSLVIAFRRRTRVDWLGAAFFTAVTVGWVLQAVLTPEDTHGWQFASDVLLLSLSTFGAALHCLYVLSVRRPSAGESR